MPRASALGGRRRRRTGCGGRAGRLLRRSLAQDLRLTGDLAARLDRDLTVPDLTRDLAGGVDRQALARRPIAFERAAHVCAVDLDLSDAHAALGDFDDEAAQI